MGEKIAIDLLWLRPGKVGGTEFFIRNLLDGFLQIEESFEFVLLLSKDNADTFGKYSEDKRFQSIIANIESKNIGKRIIWQNLFENRLLRKNKIKKCFVPVYCRPFFNGGIQYASVIHDLQAFHYPYYHPAYEVWYSKLCWITDKYKSKGIAAISNYVKQDLIETYHIAADKIKVIYNSVIVDEKKAESLQALKERYRIEEGGYYYTIAQLIPHKNLPTLLAVMKKIKDENIALPHKLLVTGISGNASKEIENRILESGLKEDVILTGFISDSEKYGLYKYCKAFLFPSIFEGFGMPPIEAMLLGTTVITTKCTSIPEVTGGKANYVDDPYDEDQWISLMKKVNANQGELDKKLFEPSILATQYWKWLTECLR